MKDKGNVNLLEGVRGMFLLSLLLLFFFFYEIGNRHFADPDEGRYVEIPREMTVTGDYVTPRLNGLKYFEKPPLFYWMQAASIETFGVGETSMRIWTMLFAIIGCLSVFFVGSRCYSANTGFLATGILATSILYYVHSRLIILDLVLSVLMNGALWCFYLIFVSKKAVGLSRKPLIIAMYALAALAGLTKGLVAIVLPAFIVFLWMALTSNWKKIREILYLPGLLVFFAIFLPWHILVAIRNDDFLYYYFIVEHFLRYTTAIHCRYQPFWFFIPVLLAGFLPWTGFFLASLKDSLQKIKKDSENAFLVCWILGVLLFFSFSNSKLIPYVLPAAQPMALLTGIALEKSINAKGKDFRYGVWLNILTLVVACGAYLLAKREIADVMEDANANLLINVFFGLLLIAAITLLCALHFKNFRFSSMLIYLFLSANMMWVINKAAVFYQETKKPSTKRFAEIINLNRKKDDLVFCYGRYYQDFPVYLHDTVGVVDFIGELEFGARSEKDTKRLITKEDFWNLWSTTNRRIFLLLSSSDYGEAFAKVNVFHRILDFNKYFLVITNQ
ncbi:MAG: glycosyltransferase family 39 protein [Holosporaceae bacterium]|jgi:4-amino-4-deoxy-L-arabinose transferase-like glycosyltransferase|nr:glycosyltransferase family 39 protein [Holosporaceae bacterium]